MPYSRKKLTFVTDPSSDIANAPRQSSNDECSNNESEGEGTHPIECDVGKLKNDRVDLHQLSRDDKYRLLTSQPNSDPSSYPRTRPYTTSSFRRFLPSWCSGRPWLHYSISRDQLSSLVGGFLDRKWAWHPQKIFGALCAP